jgi:E3 ubiquitin-protein ligase RNF14
VESEEQLKRLLEYNRREQEEVFRRQQLDCQICFDTAFGTDFRLVAECGHVFCTQCVRHYCETAIRKRGTIRQEGDFRDTI